jgi:hypothetical protein
LQNKRQQNRLVAKIKLRLNARKSTEKNAAKANRLQNANTLKEKLVRNLPMEKLVAKQASMLRQMESQLVSANMAKEKLAAKEVNIKKNRRNNSSIKHKKKAARKSSLFLYLQIEIN